MGVQMATYYCTIYSTSTCIYMYYILYILDYIQLVIHGYTIRALHGYAIRVIHSYIQLELDTVIQGYLLSRQGHLEG